MDDSKGGPKEGGDFSDSAEALETSACDYKAHAINEYQKLPASVKRRVRALKKLQYETIKIDAQFYKELYELEAKYDIDHQKIFEQRKGIISGEREPNDEECDWPSDAENDEVDDLSDTVKQKVTVSSESNNTEAETAAFKGIPEFWLKTMRNVSLIDDMIKEHDYDILKHLIDIKCVLNTNQDSGFTLEFYFSPNKYFTDSVLTKRYYFNYDIPADEPFEYEGPEIVRAKGCTINWNPGKNVTVKLIKKVQKRKGGGAKRTITKSVQEDSFFNFFQPPQEAISEDLDEDKEVLLETDFKIGQFMRDSLIPRAVLYFTGEAIDSEFDDDEDDLDDEDEDEDDEDEDDDDDDENVKDTSRHANRSRHNRAHHPKNPANSNATGEQPECRQQ